MSECVNDLAEDESWESGRNESQHSGENEIDELEGLENITDILAEDDSSSISLSLPQSFDDPLFVRATRYSS